MLRRPDEVLGCYPARANRGGTTARMTLQNQMVSTMLLAALLGSAANAAAVEVRVANEVTVSKPVSPILFGSFFELAFARSDLISADWHRGIPLRMQGARVYLSAPGQAFALLRRQGMAGPLAIKMSVPTPRQRVQAAWDLDRKTLVLFAFNLSRQPERMGLRSGWRLKALSANPLPQDRRSRFGVRVQESAPRDCRIPGLRIGT